MKSQLVHAVGTVALVTASVSAQVALVALGNVFRSATRTAGIGPVATVEGPAWASGAEDVQFALSDYRSGAR